MLIQNLREILQDLHDKYLTTFFWRSQEHQPEKMYHI